MGDNTVMAEVRLRYWAGAETAAGTSEESVSAATVREALDLAATGKGPDFQRVLSISSFLVDGRRVDADAFDDRLGRDIRLEVLPPFAGG